MGSLRFSLAGLMGLVVFTAIGAVGLIKASYPWAAGIFYATALLILGAILHGTVVVGRRRGARLGFALFAATYLLLAAASPHTGFLVPRSPLADPLDALDRRLHPAQTVPSVTYDVVSNTLTTTVTASPPVVALTASNPPVARGIIFTTLNGTTSQDQDSFRAVAHSLAAILFGLVGGGWGWALARRAEPCPVAATAGESEMPIKPEPLV